MTTDDAVDVTDVRHHDCRHRRCHRPMSIITRRFIATVDATASVTSPDDGAVRDVVTCY